MLPRDLERVAQGRERALVVADAQVRLTQVVGVDGDLVVEAVFLREVHRAVALVDRAGVVARVVTDERLHLQELALGKAIRARASEEPRFVEGAHTAGAVPHGRVSERLRDEAANLRRHVASVAGERERLLEERDGASLFTVLGASLGLGERGVAQQLAVTDASSDLAAALEPAASLFEARRVHQQAAAHHGEASDVLVATEPLGDLERGGHMLRALLEPASAEGELT